MATVDVTNQPVVVEATNDVSIVAFTESSVVVEVPNPQPVVEFTAGGTLTAGTGLAGGGYLTGNITLGLSAGSVASLAKADTAVQPGANLSSFVNDLNLATGSVLTDAIAALSSVYQPLNSNLTAISAVATTVFGRSFLELADAAASRTLIGVYSTSQVYTKSEVNSLVAAGLIPVWGTITGSILSQTDLQMALSAKSSIGHDHVAAAITSGVLAPARLGSGTADDTKYLRGDGAWTVFPTLTGDHGGLTGLADDDHTQYHTDARGDARYSLLAHTHDTRYYTESEIDVLLAGLAVSGHTHSYLPLAGGEVTGLLTVTVGAQTLALKAGPTLDHVFISFYADSAAQSTRSAYMGFGTAGQTAFKLTNEMTGGNIQFTTTGGGQVTVNGTAVSLVGHTHSYLSDAPSDGSQYARKNGAWDVVSAGGAYLPLTGGTLTGSLTVQNNTDTTLNRHVELYQAEGTEARPVHLMFHQGNRWYQRIRASSIGFSLVQGASDSLVNLYANGIALATTGYPFIYNGSGGAVRIGTAAGTYLDIGCQNSSFSHFYTDASLGFYFGNPVQFNAALQHYNGSWSISSGGTVTLDAAGSHIVMRDTDGVPADRGFVEVNGGALNLYTHDNSADVWYRAFSANIESGAVSIGQNQAAAMYLYGGNVVTITSATTGYHSYQYNGGTLSHYQAFNATEFGWLDENGSWAVWFSRANNYTYTQGSIQSGGHVIVPSGQSLWVDGGSTVAIGDRAGYSYGSIRIGGTRNGWAGAYFMNAYQANGLMVSSTDNACGLYSETGGWKTYYNGIQWFVQGSTKAVPYCDWGGGGKMTASTSTPTGGSNGDIHFQYT